MARGQGRRVAGAGGAAGQGPGCARHGVPRPVPAATRTTPRHRCGRRSRADSAAGCSRRCGTGARSPTPCWLRRGRRLAAARWSRYIATSPEREEEAREQMLVELERFARRAGVARRSCGGGELSGGAGGGEPAERRVGRGRDPRVLDLRPGAWRSWTIRRRRSARSPRKTCSGWRRARSIPGGERRVSCGVPVPPGACSCRRRPLARPRNPFTTEPVWPPWLQRGPESPRNDLGTARGVGRRPGHHVHQADPLAGNRVYHDVPVRTEQADRDAARSFAHDGRTQRGHTDGARRGDHHGGEPVHVGRGGPTPGRSAPAGPEIESLAHGLRREGGHRLAVALGHADVEEPRLAHDARERFHCGRVAAAPARRRAPRPRAARAPPPRIAPRCLPERPSVRSA